MRLREEVSARPAMRSDRRKHRRAPPPAARVRDGSVVRAGKKLWIFDFDNTLARLEPEVDWAKSRLELEPMLREAAVPEELFQRFPGRNIVLYEAARAHLAGLIAAGDAPAGLTRTHLSARLARASKIIERHELAGVAHARPLTGAIELIRSLKSSGARLAIVSSNSSRTVKRWLSLHALGREISVVVGRDSLLPLKPSPEMIERALKLCGVRASGAAYVGDAASDLLAAGAAGVQFFAVASNQSSHDQLVAHGAGMIFPTPAALRTHLGLALARHGQAGDRALGRDELPGRPRQ